MKIKEKALNFIEKHPKGCITACNTLAAIAMASVGFAIGELFISGKIYDATKINILRDWGCDARYRNMRDILPDDILEDALQSLGFASLDDIAKVAVLIQK